MILKLILINVLYVNKFHLYSYLNVLYFIFNNYKLRLFFTCLVFELLFLSFHRKRMTLSLFCYTYSLQIAQTNFAVHRKESLHCQGNNCILHDYSLAKKKKILSNLPVVYKSCKNLRSLTICLEINIFLKQILIMAP